MKLFIFQRKEQGSLKFKFSEEKIMEKIEIKKVKLKAL